MMSSNDIQKGLVVLLDVMLDVIVGEPDETDLDKPTLQELLYLCEDSGKCLAKDYRIFLQYKKKINATLDEMDTWLKRLGGYKAGIEDSQAKYKS
jgi:hypothetical protein